MQLAPRWKRTALRSLLLVLAAGCTGDIAGGGGAEPPGGAPAGASGAESVAGPRGGGGAVVGLGGATGTMSGAPPAAPAGAGGAAPGPGPAIDPLAIPGAAGLRRLTARQYANTIRDLLGAGVTTPTAIEPDDTSEHFSTIGGFVATTSSRGVEQYRAAAYDVAKQALSTPAKRAALVGCAPAGGADPCLRAFVASFGRRAWRRPLTATELDAYAGLAASAATDLGGVDAAIEHTLAALLQSPHFLYLGEIGEPDPARPGRRRLTGPETASRLSYLLLNTTPDAELLDAAVRPDFLTSAAFGRQVERLLGAPQVREVVLTFFGEHLGLGKLAEVGKDQRVYPAATATLFSAMREEAERTIADLVLTRDGDVGELFDGRTTFLNAELAKLYKVPAPAGGGFVATTLGEETGRGGLLTWPATLALHARSQRSSPTLRGVFVRDRLLCQHVPSPPPDVNDTLPADQGGAAKPETVAEQLARHRADPSCAGCHALIDPVGLGLEAFDGIGALRTVEAGRPIDATGDLDGTPFKGGRALGALLRQDARTSACLVRQLHEYGLARPATSEDAAAIAATAARWRASGQRFLSLLRELATSEAFRTVGPLR